MGKATFTVAQILKTLERCAKGYSYRLTTHCIMVHCGRKAAQLPKGAGGGGKLNRIFVADHAARHLVTLFELDPDCVEKNLPGLMKKRDGETQAPPAT